MKTFIITTISGTLIFLLLFILGPVWYFKMPTETKKKANKVEASFIYLLSLFILFSCYMIAVILFGHPNIAEGIKICLPLINTVLLIGVIRGADLMLLKLSTDASLVSREEKRRGSYTRVLYLSCCC